MICDYEATIGPDDVPGEYLTLSWWRGISAGPEGLYQRIGL